MFAIFRQTLLAFQPGNVVLNCRLILDQRAGLGNNQNFILSVRNDAGNVSCTEMTEAKINVFFFLSQVAVKQRALCSCVRRSLSWHSVVFPCLKQP